MTSQPFPIPILCAPTASGKTALALRLAEQFDLEIVSADAFTVYRGLDIGTAKPTPAERQRVTHHLIDVAEVADDFDVARFTNLAQAAIGDILSRGKRPLVVGGTGFYLSALVRGLPLTPPSNPQGRAAAEAELQERGLEGLLQEIERANPGEAQRMERNPRRVVRALEVYRATGRFPGEFGYSAPAYAYQVFAFAPIPETLWQSIESRTAQMLSLGWPAEAQWLASQVSPHANPRPTVWQALGYREALAVAQGELDPAQAAQQIAVATRQYAKRQQTWLRLQLGATLKPPTEIEKELRTWLGQLSN